MAEKTLTLYFVRHGETYFNLYDRVQGWGDSPLTERGMRDALRSGRGLKDLKFDAVYSSDLLRTIQTAELLLQENEEVDPDLEIQALPEFREFFFGSYEGGYNLDAFMAIADHLGYESKEELLEHVGPKERMDAIHELDEYQHAESGATFLERLNKGLKQVVEDNLGQSETVLIVVHGGVIHLLIEHIIPTLENAPSVVNGSVTVVQYQDGQYELERYGDTSHFSEKEEKA